MASGQAVASFALTEPGAGSEASATAHPGGADGDGYVITGSKQFISNAAIGQTTLLFAMTDPAAGKKGMSCFVVSNDTPGYQVARVEEKLGQKASDTCHLVFDGMRVPATQRIGAEGEGYRSRCRRWRPGGSASRRNPSGWRARRWTTRSATRRSAERSASRSSTIRRSAFRLVDAKTQLEAARQLVLHAARLKDAGQPALEAAAMAKLFASEAAEAICTAAIQTLGGYGFLCDYPVERIYRDVRVCQIYEGTSDIQKIILQRML